MCLDSKQDSFLKIEMNTIESLFYHSSAEMILFKSTKMLTKTQEFGEENSYRERNINIKLKADI